ncbi:MAG: purine nucleoside permease, partial [Alteromonas sp.]|nr:purine nucleoside permease [Alteromonas sp.]
KANDAKPPMKVKVVVESMFEIGNDEGDAPGEFQLWKARQNLTTQYPLPHGFHDIYANPDTGVIGMVTGMGIARASAAIMALGLDPRFDLSQAYWLVAGIAGVDPADNTIGSAIWTDYVVDGDLAHQIDAREIPSQWSTGYFPLFTHAPFENADAVDVNNSPNGEVYALNLPLAKWAYSLTKDTKLLNNEAMDALRDKYTNSANARALPNVSMGAHLSASTFWHGEKLNAWANDWVAYWTQGKGNFVTSGMEDSATLQSLSYLDNAGLVNKDRLLILRTASNFTMQPPSLSAAENLKLESSGDGYAAMGAAIEAAYNVGSQVTDYIVTHWETVKDTPPSAE